MNMPFGKYTGEELSVIALADRSYLLWILNNGKIELTTTLREAIKEALRGNKN